MSRKNSIVIVPIVLSILALFSCYGCGTVTGAPDTAATTATTSPQSILSEQQATQILIDSMNDYQTVNTVRFDMSMDILIDVVAEAESGSIAMLTTSSGAINEAENLMQMNMAMTMSTNIPGEPSASQDVSTEIYMLADYIYMKLAMFQGEQWVKVPITEDVKDQLDLDTVDQQMGMLENPVKTECLRIENVGGVECYVLSVTPNAAEMDELLGVISSSLGDLGIEEIANYADMVKDFSYLCYIAVDSNRLMKATYITTMEYSSEQMGGDSDVDSMKISFTMDMNLYDHNVPFAITLPDEAQDAMELSEDIFLN